MDLSIGHIWTTMGPLSKGIAGVLILMAIACIGVTVERLIALARSARDSKRFAQRVAPLIEDWELERVVELAEKHRHSALAQLFGAIGRRYLRAVSEPDGRVSPVELSRSEAERCKEGLGADLRRGFALLATTGSLAPFIGLLGTVVGIIAAFQGIAATGSGGLGAVSSGIAEALIETALGLLVAIPAVFLFNYLNARVNALELALTRSTGELLDELENNHGRSSSHEVKQAA